MDRLLVLVVLMTLVRSGYQCEMANADIVMLVDGSGSISNEDFKRMKSFISQMVQSLPISPDKVKIGLTQYSNAPKTEWLLNAHKDQQSLLEAINAVQQMAGGTFTGAALDHVLHYSFFPSAGMRPDSKKYVILITDGESLDRDRVSIAAKNMKDAGIEVYVIGVGQSFQNPSARQELLTIASEDVQSHVYFISSFQNLHTVAVNISSSLCHDGTSQLASYYRTDFIIRLVLLLLSLLVFISLIYWSHRVVQVAREKRRVQQKDTELEYYNLSPGGVQAESL